jgi:hypothetical protein
MSWNRLSLTILASVCVSTSSAQTITATIDAGKTGEPIAKYMYGEWLRCQFHHLASTGMNLPSDKRS